MESNESGITDADYAASVAAEEAEASELWDRLRSMGPATEWEWPGNEHGQIREQYAGRVLSAEEIAAIAERPVLRDSGPYRNHGVAVNCDNPLARSLQFAYIEPLGRYALECN